MFSDGQTAMDVAVYGGIAIGLLISVIDFLQTSRRARREANTIDQRRRTVAHAEKEQARAAPIR